MRGRITNQSHYAAARTTLATHHRENFFRDSQVIFEGDFGWVSSKIALPPRRVIIYCNRTVVHTTRWADGIMGQKVGYRSV
jgi:hypothetical protein